MATRFQGGTYGAGSDVLDWTEYFTVALDSSTPRVIAFKNIVGDTFQGRALTEFDTNVIQKNIPDKHKLTIHGIRFKYLATEIRNDEEMQLILDYFRKTTVKFTVAGKDNLGWWTLSEWFGAKQMIHVPTSAGDNVIPQSNANFEGVKNLNIPIILEQLTTYDVTLETIGNSADELDKDFLKIELIGELNRAV